MTPVDRQLMEALLRALRGMRHGVQAAEVAITAWMRAHGAPPEKGTPSGEP